MKAIDLTGKIFNRLTVLSRANNDTKGGAQWLCKCSCGNLTTVRSYQLKSGKTKSCGCINKERMLGQKYRYKHGNCSNNHTTSLHNIWRGLKYRCHNKNSKDYFRYGGRGITVCDSWFNSFQQFLDDMESTYVVKYQLDRIDNSKGYNKENCRWVSSKENNNNRYNSDTKIRWISCKHIIESNFNFCPLCSIPLSKNPDGSTAGVVNG